MLIAHRRQSLAIRVTHGDSVQRTAQHYRDEALLPQAQRAAMAEWARRNQTEFYRLYARLIPGESATAITLRDVEDLSTEELLAIARAGYPRSEEAEPDVELDDELH